MILGYLLQGLGYGFAAAAQPGPFQAYLISQTLRNGWRRTLVAALAPLISDGPIILLVLFVLSQLPEALRAVLQLAGGLFILYLAWGAFRAWRQFNATASASPDAGTQSILRAALMNALSPGPWIYWSLVTGPILIRGWRAAPANGFGFLIGFYGTIVASLVALILIFGAARQLGPRVNRAMIGISSVALAGFGSYQLILSFSAARAML